MRFSFFRISAYFLRQRGITSNKLSFYAGLQASLLIRHPETNRLYVNFDPMVLTLIKETDCMAKLELEIPESASKIRSKQATLKKHSNQLSVSCSLCYVLTSFLCTSKSLENFSRVSVFSARFLKNF